MGIQVDEAQIRTLQRRPAAPSVTGPHVPAPTGPDCTSVLSALL